MIDAPTFSIVVAAYNAEATVGATIRSALRQTRSDLEVVVVDDGSTDATTEAVARAGDPGRVRLLRQENRGPAAARNAGIAAARGRFVAMIDSDDLVLPTYLEQMHQVLEPVADEAFAYPDAWCYVQDEGRFRRSLAMARQDPPRRPLAAGEFLEELVRRNFVFNAVMVRRDVIERLGGYAPDLTGTADYELWLRLAAHGYRGVHVARPLAVYRIRSNSLSADEHSMLEGLRAVYDRVIDAHPVPPAVASIARERRAEIDRAIAVADGRRPAARTLLSVRRTLGRLRRRVDRRWLLPEPPSAAREAFPELGDATGRRLRRSAAA